MSVISGVAEFLFGLAVFLMYIFYHHTKTVVPIQEYDVEDVSEKLIKKNSIKRKWNKDKDEDRG